MSPLERLQSDTAATLNADLYFSTIPVYLFRPRVDAAGVAITMPDLQQQLEDALNGIVAKGGKYGAAVTVLMPTMDCEKPNVVGPRLRATLEVWCSEIPVVNMVPLTGTLKSAEDIGLRVAGLLHHRVFAPLGCLSAERNTMHPEVDAETGRVTYQVRMGCDLGLAPLTRVASPAITDTAGTISLACATAGASIYYSIDDSMPAHGGMIGGAGALGSTLYTAPFSAASGIGIRAAAYKTGLAGSDAAYLLTP